MERDYTAYPPPDHRDDRRDRDRDRDRDRRGHRDEARPQRRERDDRGRERDERRRSPSRSPSPAPRTRKPRKTKFDLLPEGITPGSTIPGLPGPPALALGSLPGIVQPAIVPTVNLASLSSLPTLGALGGMIGGLAGAPASQQATRHARRIYVGGLPPSANEQSIATFFSHALAAVGGNTAGPGNAVVNVYINREKNFSFVELRTVEETSNAMALDGIMFEGVTVRVRRPNDYNPAAAAALGPSLPNPNLNLAAIGLAPSSGTSASSSTGPDAAERIFVGGLPYYLTEEQCRELLGSFGGIKSFDLVKDRETGMGKGYGFVVYQDPSVTDIACAGLNGLKMGDRTLTVRRAAEGAQNTGGGSGLGLPSFSLPITLPGGLSVGGAPLFGLASVGVAAGGLGGISAAGAPAPTRVVVLSEAVTLDELTRDDDYADILEDMREEGNKHGQLLNIVIPRPSPQQPTPPGLGKVVLEFADTQSAQRSRNAMHGRRFGGRTVVALYLAEDKYEAGLYDQLA